MTITPERLAAIRVLGDDEFRDIVAMDEAVEDLLSEVDELRMVARSLLTSLHDIHERLNRGTLPDTANLAVIVSVADEITGRWQG